MSKGARSEPKACRCRFCGDGFTPAGIKNHEKYCSENPHKGAHPDDHPQIYEESASATRSEAGSDGDPDPDQSDGDASLPDRSVLTGADKTDSSSSDRSPMCPNCNGEDLTTASAARKKYVEEIDQPNPAVMHVLEAAHRYCNRCYTVWGGAIDEPTPLREVVA